jgi:hypothetical protein
MLADWSVECSAEDPVLVVPWSSADGRGADLEPNVASECQFIDLRENPYDLDQIPEAELYPPLMQALRALNAPRSPVFTAKCDAWTLDSEELEDLIQQLDLPPSQSDPAIVEPLAGFASYIDLIWRDRSLFGSFHQSEQLLHRLTRLASHLDHPSAMLESTLRPALVDLAENGRESRGFKQGFSITLYVKALGPDLETAQQLWSAALQAVVALLRSKDIALA